MALIDKATLVAKVAPPFDSFLATQLIDEFVSLERRYILRDWEPAELDGGHFCEILGRILYHQDSQHLNLTKDFGECSEYINNDQAKHAMNRLDAKMLFMVLMVVHKFRSKRGIGHVSPTYTANHMDARYMVEAVRWAMVEILRLFWTGDRDAAANAIQELLRFDVPCVGKFEDVVLVQRTDLHPEEEVLVLLHFAGVRGFTRRELGNHARRSAVAVTRALDALTSPGRREVVEVGDGRYILGDLGQKRLREQMASKLLIQ
jgi:hypothetical protein